MANSRNTQETLRTSRPKRQPKVVTRPSARKFQAASARLDAINESSARRPMTLVQHLSDDEGWLEPSPTSSPSGNRRTSIDDRRTKRQQETSSSSRRTLRSSGTRNVKPTRLGRNPRRIVLDSEDEEGDDEDHLPLISGRMSTRRNNNSSSNIQRRSNELTGQDSAMPLYRRRLVHNISEEDLDIDMKGWDTSKGKNPSASQQARAEAGQDIQGAHREGFRKREHAQVLMTPPATLLKKRHYSTGVEQLGGTEQDVYSSSSVQSRRQTNASTRINGDAEVKVKRSRTYNYVELNLEFQRYNKRNDPTYEAIWDPDHPIHEGSDVPLPGVEDAHARLERTKMRDERRTSGQ